MSEMVEFIRARVDDDERIAVAALDCPSLSIRESDHGHVRNWGPERVLKECAAKRAIADDLEKWERIYQQAGDALVADPDNESVKAERTQAGYAVTHSKVAAVAVANVWSGQPGHQDWSS